MTHGRAPQKDMAVSRRGRETPTSPMRKLVPLIRETEKRGIEVIKLNVGDPDILPPPRFLQEIRKFKGPHLGYAPSTGIAAHVAAWLSYYRSLGITLAPNQLIPTSGCAEAMHYALMAATDPGDEVLIFEPFYPSYRSFTKMLGVSLSPVTLHMENNYALPTDAVIEKSIHKKTKALIIVNPNNPTGTLFTKTEIARLVRLAEKHNLFIISDETYRGIIFKGKPVSMLQTSSARGRTIVVDSASKRFSLPGARMGCLVSYNAEVMTAVLHFCMARLSTGTIEQIALIPLLKKPDAYVKKINAVYKRRNDVVVAALKKIDGVTVHPASGAFYLTVKLPVKNSEDFVLFMLNDFSYRGKTVAVAPMAGFYATPGLGSDAVRLAYVLPEKKLREGVNILKRGLDAYRKRTPAD